MVSNEERRSIDHLIERLTAKYPDLGRERVSAIVDKTHASFSTARVRDFVPLFVERRAEVSLSKLRSNKSAATG